MQKTSENHTKQFYLLTTDIFQGIMIILVVIGHLYLWWDPTLDTRWPNIPNPAFILFIFSLPVPALFLFIYTFLMTNSLLRKYSKEEKLKHRSYLLKRAIIFFLIAEFAEILTAIVTDNIDHILNFLLTWELFHMFSFSTLFILLIFELAWYIENREYIIAKKTIIIEFIIVTIIIISIFLLIHDYSMSRRIKGLYIDFNLLSILERAIFEYGQTPIIPFLLFTSLGGFLAVFLDLPNEKKDIIKKRIMVSAFIGFILLIIGIKFLTVEIYTAPPTFLPASSSFVFLVIGFCFTVISLSILIFDLNWIYNRRNIHNTFIPLIILSKLTFTIYIFHNIVFIIPSNLPIIQVLIPDLNAVLVIGVIYILIILLIGVIWRRWNYKYSLEWLILKLQNLKWT